jgi:exodeoxyribonuclease-5
MMALTDEQSEIMGRLLDGRRRCRVQTLGGYAGCGKTTVLATLAGELPGWAPCAFTGRAAHVMQQKGIEDARTIHSLIYLPREEEDGKINWQLRSRFELGDVDGFLVDEASMVSQTLHRDMLSFDLPIIFVGDHGQLPPVGSDINLMEDPDHRLETVHRNAGEIAHFAAHLRQGKDARSFKTEGAVTVVSARDVNDEDLPGAGQIIVAFNKTRVGINETVRKLLGRTELVEEGDRIISLKNNRRSGLFNGLMGSVVEVHPAYDRLTFEADTGADGAGGAVLEADFDPDVFGKEKPEVNHDPDAPHPFDYAYAVTCHKAQGGEWSKVMVVEQRYEKLWDHRRWAYTAASRAKRELVWVTP